MASPILVALLEKPLPRGMRCDRCEFWAPDEEFPTEGHCANHENDTLAYWACVYWQPAENCGLDFMGVPLASPLAVDMFDNPT